MSRPPRWSESLLGRLLPREHAEEIVGDLREEWERRSPGMGRTVRHLTSVLSVVLHFLLRSRTRLGWRQHLGLAFRRLRREPTLSAVAVSAIALGLGVNILMLAVAETVLFAPLPYPEEDRLAVLTNEHSGSSTGGFGVAYASVRDVRERSRSVESIALYMDWQDVSYEAEDGAVQLPTAFVSAVLAAALAALGLYGVLAHGVQLQLREIGIRKALGADARLLLSRVVGRAMAMTGAGLGVGLLLAVPGSRLMQGALYGEDVSRPWVFVVVLGALALVALLSCAIPASRAVRASPSDVLRAE